MSVPLVGTLAGASFAVLTLLIMLPMKWNSNREKSEAIIAATIERFIIGFVVVNVQIVAVAPLNGLLIGLVMSIPSAVVTRAYLPVLVVGGLGSTLIGFVRTWIGI